MKKLFYPDTLHGFFDDLSLEQANLIKTLKSHCRTLLGALIEIEVVWFNRFNSQRNRMSRSIMDNEECKTPIPSPCRAACSG
jgi:hypothetical protein